MNPNSNANFDGEAREVLVFAKYPELGRCKTRLAKDIGNDAALEVYRALLNYTLSIVSALPYRKVLFVDPPERADAAHEWAPGMDLYLPQGPGDLGAKLSEAVSRRFKAGAKNLVLMGCDCPQITINTLNSAFLALESHSVVLGPSLDGGYYLLGLAGEHTCLFKNIPWSTSFVLDTTFLILKNQSLSYISLDIFSDVDNLDDYRRLCHLEPLKFLGIR